MIATSLVRLKAVHLNLIAALDGDDVETIEQAVSQFAACLEVVRTQGAWEDQAEAKELVVQIYRLSEAARIRVNFLTDVNQRRLDTLANICGRPTPLGYGSDGKKAA